MVSPIVSSKEDFRSIVPSINLKSIFVADDKTFTKLLAEANVRPMHKQETEKKPTIVNATIGGRWIK